MTDVTLTVSLKMLLDSEFWDYRHELPWPAILIIFLIFKNLSYMYECFVYMNIYHFVCLVLEEVRRVGSPGTGVTGNCEPSYGN